VADERGPPRPGEGEDHHGADSPLGRGSEMTVASFPIIENGTLEELEAIFEDNLADTERAILIKQGEIECIRHSLALVRRAKQARDEKNPV
jgi:hypothetical protein